MALCDRGNVRGATSYLCVLTAVIASQGCGGECAEGTVRHQNTCYPFDPLDKTPPEVSFSPAIRTRAVGNVILTTNEPATIFVTTDDTEPTTDSLNEPDRIVLPNQPDDVIVRFFAIDLAGNQSEEQTVVWRIDREGPAPVTAFTLAPLAGTTRTVTWDPPTESKLGGVILARVEGQLTKAPESGTAYKVGDEIEPGVTVVQVDAPGVAGSFSETLAQGSGIVRYVAWSFDDLINYGPPAGDFLLVNLPQQPLQFGRITITNAGIVDMPAPNQPTLMNVSGTATIGAGGNVTAKLSLRNDTGRVLHAPKMLVQTIVNGAISGANGSIAGKSFMRYGPLLQPGATVTTTWAFTGVPANQSITIDFEVRENPVLLAASNDDANAGALLDQVTAQQPDVVDPGLPGPRSRQGVLTGGFTPDGRAVLGARTNGSVSSFDLSSGKRLGSLDLRPQKTHVAQLVLDRGGVLGYGLVGENHVRKGYQNNGQVESFIVRFDAATLVKHGELAIGPSRNRGFQMTSDGKFLVVATGIVAQGVVVVDLETLTLARRIITGTKPDAVVLAADQRTAFIVGARVDKVDITTGDNLATFDLQPNGQKIFRAVLAGPTKLWILRSFSDAVIVDVSGAGAAETVVPTGAAALLEVFDSSVFVGGRFGNIRRFTFDGALEATPQFNPNVRGHWLGRSPF
jgi:Chitobiase/beta-hexosaminidase C-terminal domain